MELFENQIILSNDQLLSLMLQYIAYLSVHNQTEDPNAVVREIFNDQHAHDKLMQSMLTHMATYGLPEHFPNDSSIFNTTSHLVCNQVHYSNKNKNIFMTVEKFASFDRIKLCIMFFSLCNLKFQNKF